MIVTRFLFDQDWLERQRFELFKATEQSDQLVTYQDSQLQHTVNFAGVLLPHVKLFNPNYSKQVSPSKFVATPSFEKLMYELAIGLSCKLPILIEGPSGAGKTSLIEEACRMVGSQGSRESFSYL